MYDVSVNSELYTVSVVDSDMGDRISDLGTTISRIADLLEGSAADLSEEEIQPDLVCDEEVKSESVLFSIVPDNSPGLKNALLRLIGNYSSNVEIITYTNSYGNASVTTYAEPDYPWLISALLFVSFLLLCFYSAFRSVFRLIGGIR